MMKWLMALMLSGTFGLLADGCGNEAAAPDAATPPAPMVDEPGTEPKDEPGSPPAQPEKDQEEPGSPPAQDEGEPGS